MSYQAIMSMAQSGALRERVMACAAEQGEADPPGWSTTNMWKIAASPGWADKWSYAVDALTVNQNPELGARTDVISDEDILAAVQAVLHPAP